MVWTDSCPTCGASEAEFTRIGLPDVLVMPVVALSFLIGPLGAVPAALMVRNLQFREIVMIDGLATWTVSLSSIVIARSAASSPFR